MTKRRFTSRQLTVLRTAVEYGGRVEFDVLDSPPGFTKWDERAAVELYDMGLGTVTWRLARIPELDRVKYFDINDAGRAHVRLGLSMPSTTMAKR